MYDIYDLPKSIPLGRQGEQYARAVEIDCAKMLSDYPGARLTLMQRRTRGETARIVKADVSDTGVITWSPDIDAMAVAGLGAIEIVATVDDKVAKSVIAATAIAPSLTPPNTDTQSGWVKDVLDASDAAQGAMIAAQESAAAAAWSAAAAQSSANAAAGSASAAGKSATSAAESADAASGSASKAAQSASEAAGSADAASGAAGAAAESAREAAKSADAASGSKDAAAQSASEAAASAAKAEKAAQDAREIIDDDVIAEDSTWSSKQIADQNYTRFTVEGNPAVCEDVLEGYPLELSASWEPKQQGSGTPSMDNVRPITGGRDSIKITVNGAEHTLTLPDTIYGGEVDAVTGAGNANKKILTVDGDKIKFTESGIYWNLPRYSAPNIKAVYTASHFPTRLLNVNTNYAFVYAIGKGMKPYFATVEALNAYLSAQYAAGTPMQIAYELAAPESFAATGGGRIDALAGTNTISTDADTLTVGGVKPLRKPIDDTRVGTDNVWSAKHTADTLLPMQTVTGNPVVIEALEGYPLELSASWEPKQDGSGTPSPDNVRPIAGTNTIHLQQSKLNMLNPDNVRDDTYTPYGLTIKYVGDNAIQLKGTYTETGGSFVICDLKNNLLSGLGLTITSTVIVGKKLRCRLYGLRTKNETAIALNTDETDWRPGTAVDMTIKIGVYAPDALPTEYQPYEGQQSSLTLPRTIYGGKIDPATGEGQETWGYIASYAGETLPGEWISDRDEYAAGATPTVGAQVAYKLAMPVPFTAKGGQTALALAGTNAIITDADTLTITAPTPPQTTASAAEAQAAKLDYVAMMADVDVDDLTAVDDAGTDSGMDMPTDIEGSETDGKQEI